MPKPTRVERANALLNNLLKEHGDIIDYRTLEEAIIKNIGDNPETIRRYIKVMLKYGLIEIIDQGDLIRIKPKSGAVIKTLERLEKLDPGAYVIRIKNEVVILDKLLKYQYPADYPDKFEPKIKSITRRLNEIIKALEER